MKRPTPTLQDTLKALADPLRLRILALLDEQHEVCVCHIHTALGVPQPTASRHLAHLKRAGLVEDRREGLWVHYRPARLADPALQAVVDAARRAAGRLPVVESDCCRLRTAVATLVSPLRSTGA